MRERKREKGKEDGPSERPLYEGSAVDSIAKLLILDSMNLQNRTCRLKKPQTILQGGFFLAKIDWRPFKPSKSLVKEIGKVGRPEFTKGQIISNNTNSISGLFDFSGFLVFFCNVEPRGRRAP